MYLRVKKKEGWQRPAFASTLDNSFRLSVLILVRERKNDDTYPTKKMPDENDQHLRALIAVRPVQALEWNGFPIDGEDW